MPVLTFTLPVKLWYFKSALISISMYPKLKGKIWSNQMVTVQECEYLCLDGHVFMAKIVVPVHYLALPASPWYFVSTLFNNIEWPYQKCEIWRVQMTMVQEWQSWSLYRSRSLVKWGGSSTLPFSTYESLIFCIRTFLYDWVTLSKEWNITVSKWWWYRVTKLVTLSVTFRG